ncbi:MAG: hypothetical protein OEY78_09630, partial [Gammaproteobacteria bacterium]|nr:hypothetical protein [Gammaproteobacteria bacterium]
MKNIEKPILRLMIIWALSILLLVISLISLNIELDNSIFLRNRYWFFQIILAISSFKFIAYLVKNENTVYLSKIFFFSLMFLILVASVQLFLLGPFKLKLLSSEPSQAGGVFLFWFLGYFYLMNLCYNKFPNKFVVLISIIVFVLMGSKAIFLTVLLLLILLFIFFLSIKQRVFVGLFISFISLSLLNIINIEYIDKMVLLADVLILNGLDGLDFSYGIYDSFIVRVGSVITAIGIFIEQPLGIGFGVYNSLFSDYIAIFVSTKSSPELNMIISGQSYATPKSYLLEFILSTGIVGTFILLIDVVKRDTKKNRLFNIVMLCLISQSFIVELTPFLSMIYIFV